MSSLFEKIICSEPKSASSRRLFGFFDPFRKRIWMPVCFCLPVIVSCSHSKNGTDCFHQEDCPVGICRLGTCVDETRESPATDTDSSGEDSPEPFGDTDGEDTSTNTTDMDKDTKVDTGAETDSDETDTVPMGSSETPTEPETDTVSESGTGTPADSETDTPTDPGNDTATESGNDSVTESGGDTIKDTESNIEEDTGTVITKDTETGSEAGDSDTIPEDAIFVSIDGSDSDGDGTASNPYRTVTKGLSVAEAGDTVWVKTGEYQEGEVFPLILFPGVTLQGEANTSIGSSQTDQDIILSGRGGSSDAPSRLMNLFLSGGKDGWHIGAGYVEIENVHLTGGGNFGLAAYSATRLNLKNVYFHGFGESTDWGPGAAVYATNSANVTGTGITITDPPAPGVGILAQETAVVEFDGITIANRDPDMAEGPPLDEQNQIIFQNVVAGVMMVQKTDVTLTNCEISRNSGAVLVLDESNLTIEDGRIVNNISMGIWAYNLHAQLGMIRLSRVDITNNGPGFGIDLFRKNFRISDASLSYHGTDGMHIRSGGYADSEVPTVASIVDTTFEGNLYQGLSVFDAFMPLTLEEVRFIDNLGAAQTSEDEENLAQWYLAPEFTGTVRATDVVFSFDEMSDAFTPPPGTVTGPSSYMEEASGLLHYKIHGGGTIVFESSEPE
jgi:hypothetical protein